MGRAEAVCLDERGQGHVVVSGLGRPRAGSLGFKETQVLDILLMVMLDGPQNLFKTRGVHWRMRSGAECTICWARIKGGMQDRRCHGYSIQNMITCQFISPVLSLALSF